jgi:hypothetical protein
MKKIILIIFYLIFFQLIIYAQVNTSIINQKTIGGSLDDNFVKAVKTADGGYLVGLFSISDISGDKSVAPKGVYHIWLLKLNNNLSIQWQKSIGGSDFDRIEDILLMDDGNFFLLAGSDSPISMDKTVDNYGTFDYWLLKLNPNGDILWQKTYGGDSAQSPNNMIQIDENRFLLGGTSNSNSSGLKSENSYGYSDLWFILIDSLGNVITDKSLGGNDHEFLSSIFYNKNQNTLFAAGMTTSDSSGTITTHPFNSFSYHQDYFLFSLNDTDLQQIFDARYGGNDLDYCTAITSINGFLYLGGNSLSDSSGVKTDISRSNGQYSDYWMLKLDKNGSIIWDKTIGGNYRESLYHMEVTNDYQILLIGSSSSDVGWEKTEPRINQQDYWIVSLDTNANILWQKTLGGNLTDDPKQLIVLGHNHYIVFGDSNSDYSGHKTSNSRGGIDLWIVEISSNLTIDNFSKNSLQIMPNPATDCFSFIMPENSQNGLLYIFNPSGQIVHSEKIYNAHNNINISYLNKGIYFVSFYNEQGIGYSAKMIKQ